MYSRRFESYQIIISVITFLKRNRFISPLLPFCQTCPSTYLIVIVLQSFIESMLPQMYKFNLQLQDTKCVMNTLKNEENESCLSFVVKSELVWRHGYFRTCDVFN